MKTVILAGGLGTRLSEETVIRPKPMVEVGGKPLLWHILKLYRHYGNREFLIALGYKGEWIKRYFLEYHQLQADITINLADNTVLTRAARAEDWLLHLIDTGSDTLTGGRLLRLRDSLRDHTFFMTYGDGISNIDLSQLLAFHRKHGKLATVTAVRPPARFGGILFDGDQVVEFTEKPQIGEGWINGGFFVLEPAVLDRIAGDHSPWETAPLESLALDGQLMAYRHHGFWQCVDTLRDLRLLESLWDQPQPPWKVWSD